MLDVIEIENEYFVRARSSLTDRRTHVLMCQDLFAIFDRHGDFQPVESGEHGLFYEESRHLSTQSLRLPDHRLWLLSSTVREDNAVLAVDLTNPDLALPDGNRISRGAIHVCRTKFLRQNASYEQIRTRNFGVVPVTFELVMEFEADFIDIFEVRGHQRSRRGEHLKPVVDDSSLTFSYKGLDGILRVTRVTSSLAPTSLNASEMRFVLHLEPQAEITFSMTIACSSSKDEAVFSYEQAYLTLAHQDYKIEEPPIRTSNAQFNDWLNRSRADLRMMVTTTPQGLYPYAGVPWFSTPFGRDGIITALQYLWLDPDIAKGVLTYLASTQATQVNPVQDSEPGKILHETRKSESARLGEVPFGRYYGSADSTPLFIYLAAAYFDRTDDIDFIRTIWPNIELALNWVDRFGDRDNDGFVEYGRLSQTGLIHQGWKDSHDSIFHANGDLAGGPIALCEIQGYVYAAKRGIAAAAAALGNRDQAEQLELEAESLRARFEQSFWCEEIGLYALALDGDKKQCQVRSSNAGHCLFTGIANEERAGKVMSALGSKTFFSGWGVRTIAESEKRFNPMSYHNGSVWPHDNSLIAFGCIRRDQKKLATKILSGLLGSSIFLDLHRLPELFCGFMQRAGEGPTLYPLACSPQAWAAGAVFLTLQSCLGLVIRARESRIYLYHPRLPESLERLCIQGLKVGSSAVDLELWRHENSVSVNLLRRTGNLEIAAIK
jgi:glycogen debranching enzyme